jgi:hypothetical protein
VQVEASVCYLVPTFVATFAPLIALTRAVKALRSTQLAHAVNGSLPQPRRRIARWNRQWKKRSYSSTRQLTTMPSSYGFSTKRSMLSCTIVLLIAGCALCSCSAGLSRFLTLMKPLQLGEPQKHSMRFCTICCQPRISTTTPPFSASITHPAIDALELIIKG